MRPILALFLVAALGFLVILKKDAPEAVATKTQTNHLTKVGQHNSWKKHTFDSSHSIAKNATRQSQENEIP
jgi:hypothetical protein